MSRVVIMVILLARFVPTTASTDTNSNCAEVRIVHPNEWDDHNRWIIVQISPPSHVHHFVNSIYLFIYPHKSN
jgi:hypothetical protein